VAARPVFDAYHPRERIAGAYCRIDAGHKEGAVMVTMTNQA
jgi:hypothetical protein